MKHAILPLYIRFGLVPDQKNFPIQVWKAFECGGAYYPYLPEDAGCIAMDYFESLSKSECRVYLVSGTEVYAEGVKGETRLINPVIIREITDQFRKPKSQTEVNHNNERSNKCPIYTLCGSMKFIDTFKKLYHKFTTEGKLVLLPAIFDHPSEIINDQMHKIYDDIHRQKIEMADVVYIVNSNDYIGEDTKKEIEYAVAIGKKIEYLVTKEHDVFNDGVPNNNESNIEVAPDGELSNWNYTLDETNGTVTLNQYTNTTETDVVVYVKYQLNGKVYDTKIKSNDSNSNTSYMFSMRSNIQTITFNEGIDTSNVINMNSMFSDCSALTAINGLENWDTSNVTNMNSMFCNCRALVSLYLAAWNTSNVENMWVMFYNCNSLISLDLRGWDTSNVSSARSMFHSCKALTKILVTSGKWAIREVCDTSYMFNECGVSTVTLSMCAI